MRSNLIRCCLIVLTLAIAFSVFTAVAQKQDDRKKTQPTDQQDTIKIDTDLVMVPVIASDRNDAYVPDLRKEEFTILEDGVKQEIAFFASIKEPFHVALLLDTSLSASLEKLKRIKQAAHEFIEQLQGGDRVSVISFDDSVKEACYFTGNRQTLRDAINSVQPGGGTKLYDAVTYALGSLKRAKANRKAIVILTDGVDWHSDQATFDDSIADLEESSVIVYPIRYNTRPEVEAMLRNQKAGDLGTIFGSGGGAGGTTPTTVPGETRVPTRRPGQDDPYKLPIPKVELPPIGGRYPDGRYPDDPNSDGRGRRPDGRRPPDPRDYPDQRRNPDSPDPNDPNTSRRSPRDGTEAMLDRAYKTADQYLKELAESSGGELNRADAVTDLPEVFIRIAGELRNQYLLGYYPTNAARDGKYRKIKVQITRKDTVIRARPGYRPGEAKK